MGFDAARFVGLFFLLWIVFFLAFFLSGWGRPNFSTFTGPQGMCGQYLCEPYDQPTIPVAQGFCAPNGGFQPAGSVQCSNCFNGECQAANPDYHPNAEQNYESAVFSYWSEGYGGTALLSGVLAFLSSITIIITYRYVIESPTYSVG